MSDTGSMPTIRVDFNEAPKKQTTRPSTAAEAYQAGYRRGEQDAYNRWLNNSDNLPRGADLEADDLGLEQDAGTGYVYPTLRGVRSSNGIPLAAFGGGGGWASGSNGAVLRVANESGWLSRTISEGGVAPIRLSWSSVEDQIPTGDGSATVTVNGVRKAQINLHQGEVTIDIAPYCAAGTNAVKVTVADVYDNSRTINFTVSVVVISISSTFDASAPFTGSIAFPYVPLGEVTKTVRLLVDGVQVGTTTTDASGRQLSFAIPQQAHGPHAVECWFEASINGEIVESNHLYYELICIDEHSTTPIIVSPFALTTVPQYSTVSIPYTVYNPASLTAEVTITVNGAVVSRQTVDRTEQAFPVRATDAGALQIVIASGTASKTFALTVTASDIQVAAETQDLALHLTSVGRSNNEAAPEVWQDSDNNVSATLTGFNWASDGWVQDPDGITVLRVAGDARVTIPYHVFGSDFRRTGKTVELEFATRDVLSYDAVILSCLSGGRGLTVTAQMATLTSEQSTVSMQYKEDEHVRLSFVVEKAAENRLLYVYVNGIMSGCVQYPVDDDFQQAVPVGVSIGSSSCTMDIYHIRVYDNGLTRHQILDNWIADSQRAEDVIARYTHNDVYDGYGKVSISRLPVDLPYMILSCPETPQYKGDKKTCAVSYVDPVNPARSFTADGVQINVQGTSSAPYARKNYDLQFKQGFVLASGTAAENYELAPDIVPFDRFVLKADVASSEGANNVELVKLYCDINPYRRREQIANPKVRQGIYGFPIVVFWHNPDDDSVSFLGKYNFNLPKRAPGPYGYSGDMESWEFQNNTSALMLFHTAYFDETPQLDPTTGESKARWRYDYEARFPSDEWTSYAKLQELHNFIVSTKRDEATGSALADPYNDCDGTTHTVDNAAYRLARFRTEFGNYAEVESFIFYYLFTELFLMVDSRAKNLFIGFSGSDTDPEICRAIDRKAVAEPYDMDTALGTNNEGALVFGYDLEDIDHLPGGADVFNGQQSVLWCNLRDAFGVEIMSMYQQLRSAGTISYAEVEGRFEAHQAKWPEAIFNEDAQFKYIDPLVAPDPGKTATGVYLSMLQGSKAEQRKWWLFNRFRYMDAKWNAGDALSDIIQLRGYAKANITITPYADIYATAKYGSYLVSVRGHRGESQELVCPLDNVNDTEIYVYSAPQVASIGDLSGLKVGFADFSKATRIQSIKLGDAAQNYTNGNLLELHLGSNTLLRTLDVRNCTALGSGDMQAVDLSGCANIEHVYFDGTRVTGVTLPNGGSLKTLHLPGTVSSLTIRNHPALTDFALPSYSQITTLRLEYVSAVVDSKAIVTTMAAASRVRLIGFDWAVADGAAAETLLEHLGTMRGLDGNGGNTEEAQLIGTITVGSSTTTQQARIAALLAQHGWTNLAMTYLSTYVAVYYYSYDGTELYHVEYLNQGANARYSEQPSRQSTAQYSYAFRGWSTSQNASAPTPEARDNVESDVALYAAYTATLRSYTVRFWNGNELLQTVTRVPYGGTAVYTGGTPDGGEGSLFDGWQPSNEGISGDTDCVAQFLTGVAEVPTATTAEGAYGIEWDFSQNTITRLGLASSFADPVPATTLSETGSSPFDGIMPWAGMRRYNIIDGAVAYSEDDAGYSESAYDTVVYIPEFYYTAHKDTANGTWLWAISPTPLEGYVKHPGSGRYVGRFKTSGSSAAVYSMAGVQPLVNTSRTNFRTYSRNKGAKWYMLDLASWSALQMLYLVEFANFDSQAKLGGGYGSDSQATGSTTGALYHTINGRNTYNSYRWVEQPFGRCREWVDGFVASDRAVYTGIKNATFGDKTTGLFATGITLPSSNYISGFGYSEKCPYAFIPDSASDESSAVPDYVFSGTGNRALVVGSHSGNFSFFGFFYFNANDAANIPNSGTGSRLLYIP
ncbi:MAG: hypothetical protein IKM84_04620 [Oscillospiraceae bacterium]|nr:hypothetical protein [Oscillospiraceae bacterium]